MKKVQIRCITADNFINSYGTTRISKELDFSETTMEYHNGQGAIDNLYDISLAKEGLPIVIFLNLNRPILIGLEVLYEFQKLPNLQLKKTYYVHHKFLCGPR